MLTAVKIRETFGDGDKWLKQIAFQDKMLGLQTHDGACTYCGIKKEKLVQQMNDLAETALHYIEENARLKEEMLNSNKTKTEKCECSSIPCPHVSFV